MPSAGRDRCNLHGGKTPRGAGLPQTRHGRYSRDLPARLGERYEEGLVDEELYDLRAETAVVQARIGDLLRRVDSGESGHLWAALVNVWPKYLAALRKKDEEEAGEYRQYIDQLIHNGAGDYQAWVEVMAAMENKRKLADAARKREMDLGLMVSATQIGALILAMVDIFRGNVRRHVSDEGEQRELLLSTSTAIDRLLDIGDRG